MEDNNEKEQEKVEAKENADLLKEIKRMESKKRQEAMVKAVESKPQVADERMHFDGWYALRSPSIPGHHMKEILRADFGARGLGDRETLAKYDMALEKYGVKLK